MSTKNDGLKYLKNRTELKRVEIEKEFDDKFMRIIEKQKIELAKIEKELNVKDGYLPIKLKNGEILKMRYNEYGLKNKAIIKLDEEIKEHDYSKKQRAIRLMKEQAMKIEQAILLHGMSSDIKKMLENF